MFYGPPQVKVLKNQVKPGDEYRGYEFIPVSGGSGQCWCRINIMEDGTPLVFGKRPLELNEGEVFLHYVRDMTWQEERQWYIDSTDMEDSTNVLNLIGIHCDMYGVGDAIHEMWNGWITFDWREQLMRVKTEDFFIIGVAPAPYGNCAFSDPVALVAEYRESGDRFWCHTSKDWIEQMREESKEIYMAYC